MAKTKISEFSATPANNTDIDSINIAEGCAPSGINNAIRELMAQLKDFQTGAVGDSFNGPVGTTTAAAGAFTTLSASGTLAVTGVATLTAQPILSSLTASKAVFSDASKGLVSNDITGTGNVVMSASPTLTGTISGVNATLSGTLGVTGVATLGAGAILNTPASVTLTNGTGLPLSTGVTGTLATTNGGTGLTSFTANGVVYASSTSALATGSALTFDGTNLFSTGAITLDTNLGIFFSGLGATTAGIYGRASGTEVAFNANGSEQMRLTSTGLGIGTSSTDRALTVYTTDSSGKIALFSNGYLNTNVYISADPASGSGVINVSNNAATAAFPLMFQMNGTERMRLDTAGNLGLGVTPSAWYNIVTALQVKDTAIYSTTNTTSISTNDFVNSSAVDVYKNNGFASLYAQNNGSHKWYTAPSGTAGAAISFTQAMTLDASGNLSIGTTSNPSGYRLKVNGITQIEGANTVLNSGQLSSTATYIQSLTTSATAADLVFFNTSERMRLDASGNLLVGTTSAISNGKISVSFSGAASGGANFQTTTTDANTINFINSSGTAVGRIYQDNTSTSYVTSSDYRLKDITGPITTSGAYIDSLNPVEGTWKADGSTFVGLLAHEAQEASRTVVATGVKDGEQMQGMSYSSSEMIANLIAEIQDLRKRLAAAGI